MTYYGLAGDRYLAHHGIRGMKWGVRRYQNEDGTFTDAGKKHYQKKIRNNWIKAHNGAAASFNRKIDEINSKYDSKEFEDNFGSKIGQKYVREVDNLWKTSYKSSLRQMYGDDILRQIGEDYINSLPLMNQYEQFIRK